MYQKPNLKQPKKFGSKPEKPIRSQPIDLIQKGINLHQIGKIPEAEKHYLNVLKEEPDNFDALHLLGVAAYQQKKLATASEFLLKAIKVNDKVPAAYLNLGNVQRQLGNFDLAISYFNRALSLQPDYAEVHSCLGNLMTSLGRYKDAISAFDLAVKQKPHFAEAHYNKGNALAKLNRPQEALSSYELALKFNPKYAIALVNKGNILKDLRQTNEAILSYRHATQIEPQSVLAHTNLAAALESVKEIQQAIKSYEAAFQILPSHEFLLGALMHAKMLICDWTNFDHLQALLYSYATKEHKVTSPFPALSLIQSADLQQKITSIFVESKQSDSVLGDSTLKVRPLDNSSKKIKLAYFSSDFRDHPVSYLLARVLELHNKDDFEIIGFSLVTAKQSDIKDRLLKAFDHFFEVQHLSDLEIANLSRELGVHIAIDLNGHTSHNRSQIFSYEAAPLQVNFLGYPGTLGNKKIDYIISDKTVIPKDSQSYFTEKIIYLPNCYLPIDDLRLSVAPTNIKHAHNLPQGKFIFCSFNAPYKINNSLFRVWMSVLSKVTDSVLWLSSYDAAAQANLRRYAMEHGVDPQRIIFASRLEKAEDHIARIQLADLALDTFPYNGHTTTVDALIANVPVVTCQGQTFAGRVASSLMCSLDMNMLITTSLKAYENKIVEIAHSPQFLSELKMLLKNKIKTSPSFDSLAYTQGLEKALKQAHHRYLQGLEPASIELE
jgi:protein O-GlcNAc transferase